MKNTLFTLIVIAFTLCQGTIAQSQVKLPLCPVKADSVLLFDFFWYGFHYNATRRDSLSPIRFPWAVKAKSASKIAQMESAWDRQAQQLSILGDVKEKSSDLSRSLKLFRESYTLAQLTGKAKYIDLAERVLINRIVPLWKYATSSKGRDEANGLLRSCATLAYSTSGHDVYVNMFIRGNAHITNDSLDFYLQCFNSSPWDYETSLMIKENMDIVDASVDTIISPYKRIIFKNESQADSVDITFHIRIPSWVTGKDMLPSLTTPASRSRITYFVGSHPAIPEYADGYAIIRGRWAVGDYIRIKYPTPILRVTDKRIPNQVALQRGPLIYSFDDFSSDWHLDTTLPISHEYRPAYEGIQLSGEMDTPHGREPFKAIPCFKYNKTNHIFVPTK